MTTTETQTAEEVQQDAKPAPAEALPRRRRKVDAEERIAQLVTEVKQLKQECRQERERIADLKLQVSESDAELARWRSAETEREAQLKAIPGRIARALAEGRSHFADFDEIISAVEVDQEAFKTLPASTSGWFFMYAAGLGVRVVHNSVQAARQAKAEARRVEYYRQQHLSHFGKEG